MKGQFLETRDAPVPIRANLLNRGNLYVVPKRDGRVTVGGTKRRTCGPSSIRGGKEGP